MPLQPSANTTNPLRLSEIIAEHACAREIYTSGSASVTAPAGVDFCIIKLWGAGGGGGGYYDEGFQAGGGGGGGAFIYKQIAVTAGVTSFTYSIGAGGTAGIGSGASGGNGANSTITGGTTLTAGGGGGGGPALAGLGGVIAGGGGDALSANGNDGTGNNGTSGGAEFRTGLLYGRGGGGGTNLGQNGTAGTSGAVIFEWYFTSPNSRLASSLYRNATYVPDNALNSGIPTSGSFNLSTFLSTSAVGFTTDLTIGNSAAITAEVGSTFNGRANTIITFNADGTYEASADLDNTGFGSFTSGTFVGKKWASGYGAGDLDSALYYIWVEELAAGSGWIGPSANTWHSLNTERKWRVYAAASDNEVSLRFKIGIDTLNNGVYTEIDQMDVDLNSMAAGIN